jgi:galactokinase
MHLINQYSDYNDINVHAIAILDVTIACVAQGAHHDVYWHVVCVQLNLECNLVFQPMKTLGFVKYHRI